MPTITSLFAVNKRCKRNKQKHHLRIVRVHQNTLSFYRHSKAALNKKTSKSTIDLTQIKVVAYKKVPLSRWRCLAQLERFYVKIMFLTTPKAKHRPALVLQLASAESAIKLSKAIQTCRRLRD